MSPSVHWNLKNSFLSFVSIKLSDNDCEEVFNIFHSSLKKYSLKVSSGLGIPISTLPFNEVILWKSIAPGSNALDGEVINIECRETGNSGTNGAFLGSSFFVIPNHLPVLIYGFNSSGFIGVITSHQ